MSCSTHGKSYIASGPDLKFYISSGSIIKATKYQFLTSQECPCCSILIQTILIPLNLFVMFKKTLKIENLQWIVEPIVYCLWQSSRSTVILSFFFLFFFSSRYLKMKVLIRTPFSTEIYSSWQELFTWVFCHNLGKIHLLVIEILSFSCSVLLVVKADATILQCQIEKKYQNG